MKLAISWVVFMAACGGTPAPSAQSPQSSAPNPQPTAGATADPSASIAIDGKPAATDDSQHASMSQAQAGSTDQSAGDQQLTDNGIAAVVSAANTGEVEQARVAETKAKDARVKKFAAHMVTDHTDANQKETQVLNKAGLKAETNPVSTQLTNDSTKLVESLKSQTGAEFDRTYIDAQVKQHQQLIDMIDHKFMPNVKSPDLKQFLQNLRPKLEVHLREALDIQKSLAGK